MINAEGGGKWKPNIWPSYKRLPMNGAYCERKFLNGSNARFLVLKFDKPLQFNQIGTEGGLLPDAPVVLDQLLMSPAERADVIVDFSSFKVGDEILLLNLGPDSPFGSLPIDEEELANPETTGQVMQFRVVESTGQGNPGSIPTALPSIDRLSTTLPDRVLTLNEMMYEPLDIPIEADLGTAKEGRLRFADPITENPMVGDTEIWSIVNLTADAHPIHLHLVMFQVIDRIPTLELDAYDTPTLAELAPVVDGKPDINRITEINLTDLGQKFRTQKIVFETAVNLYNQMQHEWKGNKEYLLGQLIAQVERFIASDKIHITPPLFHQDDLRRRILITLNMSKVIQHIWEAIRFENTESLELVVDTDRPLRSTGDMLPWYTSRPWEFTRKSHINRVVLDSTWEASEAYELERNKAVTAWAKNDHLGFVVYYTYQGTPHTFYPDYLVRLANGTTLVLEVKGQDDQQNRTKREFLDEWVRAVNAHGGFGEWVWAVSKNPADIKKIISEAQCLKFVK